MSRPDIAQIIHALKRSRDALQHQADTLCDALDYGAEFPAEDAERMREAIDILEPVARGVPLDLKPDPMDTGLPCDVRLGYVSFGKGVPLRVLVEYARRHSPKPVSQDAARNLSRLQGSLGGALE